MADQKVLLDFYISETKLDGKGQIWTSEKIVEMAGAAALIYIGGRWMGKTINKAVSLYKEKTRYVRMVNRAMKKDFSWDKSAILYKKLYEEMIY